MIKQFQNSNCKKCRCKGNPDKWENHSFHCTIHKNGLIAELETAIYSFIDDYEYNCEGFGDTKDWVRSRALYFKSILDKSPALKREDDNHQ